MSSIDYNKYNKYVCSRNTIKHSHNRIINLCTGQWISLYGPPIDTLTTSGIMAYLRE